MKKLLIIIIVWIKYVFCPSTFIEN